MGETGSVTVLAPVLAGIDLLLELFLMSCVTLNAQSSWGFLPLTRRQYLPRSAYVIIRNTHTTPIP